MSHAFILKKKEKFELPKSEVLVFTSPSNVESYFANTTVADNQKVIAIGKSTDKKLKAMGVKKVLLPVSFDEVGLAEVVFSLSTITANKEGAS